MLELVIPPTSGPVVQRLARPSGIRETRGSVRSPVWPYLFSSHKKTMGHACPGHASRNSDSSDVLESTILPGHNGRCTTDRAGYPTDSALRGQRGQGRTSYPRSLIAPPDCSSYISPRPLISFLQPLRCSHCPLGSQRAHSFTRSVKRPRAVVAGWE